MYPFRLSIVIGGVEAPGDILTPHGDTRIYPADIAMVFSRDDVDDQTVNAFIEPSS